MPPYVRRPSPVAHPRVERTHQFRGVAEAFPAFTPVVSEEKAASLERGAVSVPDDERRGGEQRALGSNRERDRDAPSAGAR